MRRIPALMLAAAAATVALPASAVEIGGISFQDGFNIKTATITENAVGSVGDVLAGIGVVNQINGSNSFCAGGGLAGLDCELTFEFGDFEVSALDTTDPADTRVTFTGGFVNFYSDTSPDADLDANTGITDGLLWLTLIGTDSESSGNQGVAGEIGTLHAALDAFDPTEPVDSGTGSGWLDVDTTGGGAANGNFDTNTRENPRLVNDFADFLFTSSFQPDEGDTFAFDLAGTAELRGEAIPAPATLGLLGLGLLGLGGLRRLTR